MRRLLLLGAGHAHALLLSRLARKPLPETKVALVTPAATAPYSGMVPGYLAGHYGLEDIEVDFARLAERAGAGFVGAEVAAVDPGDRSVRLADGRVLEYDILSINVGSLTRADIPGAEHAVSIKPFERSLAALAAMKGGRAAVIGGGMAGCEIAMALAHRGLAVALYYDASLPGTLADALRESGVQARIGAAVKAIEPGPELITEDMRAGFDLALLATGPLAQPWLRASGLEVDADGFVAIDETLRSPSHRNVFAVGDCATLVSAPHPRSGVYAVKQGRILVRNVRALVEGEHRLARYRPQRRSLMLVSCGAKRAIAFWGGFTAKGAWVWWLKDAIDRRWIARL